MNDPRIPVGICASTDRYKICDVALQEWDKGVIEKPIGSNRGPEVDKYLPKFWLSHKTGPAWCAFFVGWVVNQATGLYPPGGRIGGVMAMMNAAKKVDRWTPKRGRLPIPGDIFVMDTDGDRGNHGHTGIVIRVSEDGALINTVEGNCGQRVQLGLREVGDSQIIGWIDTAPGERPEFELGAIDAKKVGGAATR